MYAIINANGRQRRVSPGDIVWFENQNAQVGDTITFDNVLLLNDGETSVVGAPTVEGASVEAKVLRQVRDRKVTIYKFKRRKGYARKKGHRHAYIEARVTDIHGAGQGAQAAPEAPAATDEAPTEQEPTQEASQE